MRVKKKSDEVWNLVVERFRRGDNLVLVVVGSAREVVEMEWTKDRVEELRKLAAAGKSAREMAGRFGTSRNAIIGKLRRLIGSGRAKHAPKVRSEKFVPLAPGEADPIEALVVDGGFVSTLMLSDRTCRWPHGEPGKTGFHYCGQGPVAESVYCAGHRARSVAASQPRAA